MVKANWINIILLPYNWNRENYIIKDIVYLQVRGANSKINVDSKVRLQLYLPPTRYRSKPDKTEVSIRFLFKFIRRNLFTKCI